MADDRFVPRIGGSLSGEWDVDAKEWQFDEEPPGPAGLATTNLADGVEVDIDVAEPRQIVGLWMPEIDDAERAQQLAGAVYAAREEIGRLALAEDVLAGTLNPSDGAVALATIDRALASRQVAGLLNAHDLPERVRAAIDAAHANADDLMASERPDLVADALQDLMDHGGAMGELDALVRALEGADRDRFHDARIASADLAAAPQAREAAAASTISRLLDIVDLDALPEGLGPHQVAARATTASELEVRVSASAPIGAWWVRAHRHGALIAAAPIQASDGGGVARILVPPAHLHHVELDITTRPGDARPSWTYRAAGRAVRAGRRAASHQRAAHTDDADRGWRECARAWEQAHDMPRMRAAMDSSRESRYLSGIRTLGTLGGRPLLSDHVAD